MKGTTMTETFNLPELIVVARESDRQFVERQIKGRTDIRCVSIGQGVRAFCGIAVARITVAADVNLDRDFEGEGSLRAILERRMITFGDKATLIQLP